LPSEPSKFTTGIFTVLLPNRDADIVTEPSTSSVCHGVHGRRWKQGNGAVSGEAGTPASKSRAATAKHYRRQIR